MMKRFWLSAFMYILSVKALFAPILNTPPSSLPAFRYDTAVTPSWPITKFLLTQYSTKATTTARNRLHIEFYQDDPNDSALIYSTASSLPTQIMNKTPDPYGILTNLYDQLLNTNVKPPKRFVIPSIQFTIPLNVSSLPDAKFFVQGLRENGLANGIQIKYVKSPAITVLSGEQQIGIQFVFPLNPFDVTWCSTDQPYQCPQGSPFNSGIPYMYPKAANLDMSDALFEVLKNAASSGAVYGSYIVVGSNKYSIPYASFKTQIKLDESIPTMQTKVMINGTAYYPPLLNGL